MEKITVNRNQIVLFIIVLSGLIISVYLASTRQIFKSRASLVNTNFDIIQNTSPQISAECTDETCVTKTLDIIIKPKAALQGPEQPVGALVSNSMITPSPSPIQSVPLSSCVFYRQGAPDMFKNPAMPAVITEITGKIGIPASALAALLRIENPGGFGTPDINYVINDYDGHTSGIAYGAVQFVPSTFEGVFNRNKEEIASKFGKTVVQSTIEPQRYPAPVDNIFRISSIRDNLTAAAFKMRADAGSPPPFDMQDITNILSSYFGSHCGYEGTSSNYCEDMLRGMNECGDNK